MLERVVLLAVGLLTIKGVHEGIARDGCSSATRRSSQGVVHTSLVASHGMLDSFVRRKVNSMRRSGSHNHTGHATPQAKETLAGSYLICATQNTSSHGRRARVENLHSRLPQWVSVRLVDGTEVRSSYLYRIDGIHGCMFLGP